MRVADYLGKYLQEQGITHVFELVGGMITVLLDSIEQNTEINIISMHHEQGAAFAAEGWARITGLPGVAFATSGPGATNLLTSIGSCYFDSVPAVFITGQVNRHEQKGTLAVRQLGFQETDIISMALPITKAAWQVHDPEAFPELIHKAFQLALEGRPGPVLIDIPMDVQRIDIGEPEIPKVTRSILAAEARAEQVFLKDLGIALQKAERPLILAGGGIQSAQAAKLFVKFAEMIHVPVVWSLMGKDLIPYSHYLRVGMIGSYGNRWANLAIGEADLLIVLGSRLDVRQTGALAQEFKAEKEIFHVDIEQAEMNNRIKGCQTLQSHLIPFFDNAIKQKKQWLLEKSFKNWSNHLKETELSYSDLLELKDAVGINPNTFIHSLTQRAAKEEIGSYVVDVGQHQMWAAQSVEIREQQRFLTSGGMGSMGFALPTAIGAALATRKPTIVIAGDGGFQCNIQELQTIVRNNLAIKIIVMNNKTHGMVRQFQSSYFKNRYQSTLIGYSAPDFVKIAEAYGISAKKLTFETELDEILEWLWREPSKLQLLEVVIDTFTNVYPKIAFGQPITGMEPEFQPLEMEGT
jgi:acetolactate synthase I/II/III large subunit